VIVNTFGCTGSFLDEHEAHQFLPGRAFAVVDAMGKEKVKIFGLIVCS
jgi:hypothetical protein